MNIHHLLGNALCIVVGLSVLTGWAVLGDVLRRAGVQATNVRRVVHMLVGLTVAAAPLVLGTPRVLYVLAIVFIAVNSVAWARGWLPGMHEARPSSLGTVLFPLSVIPAVGLTWMVDPVRIPAFQIAYLVLAIADPVAAWRGTEAGDKSPAGSLTFGLTALGLTVVSILILVETQSFGVALTGAIAVAAATTAAEAIGRDGWDNLFIVLAGIGAMIPWLDAPASPIVMYAVLSGVVFAGLAYALRALTWDGAIAGGLLAASFVAWVDPIWAIPAVVFFVGSSALSLFGRSRKAETRKRVEKVGARDSAQVAANGGVGWLMLGLSLAISDPLVLYGMLGAFAAAAADTWATELGSLSRHRPISLRTWTRVPRGASGAVSPTGTVASALGAATVALSAWAIGLGGIGTTVAVIVAGIAGSWTDSLVGATLQANYRNPMTGEWTERRPANVTQPIHGYTLINNDVVNAIGTATGACVAILLIELVVRGLA
ncbi:hypothetical protein CRI94_00100 [Longibacter salinarum]|uniref:DUF92 domain-containing protein n=1 Tax=Longibacter salinarum TaxID=1850348 RepID=A0A2A8D1C5_9BACT|nr:DUF92 domain-containing protein [Longibacter salinarum]PEN14735.1 hypothetical protein CRI94_00100 [Longibacter salinarum]